MAMRTHKSIIWVWVFTLLTATIGVSVQQIYCYCVGKTSISFFAAEDPCIAEADMSMSADCCHQPEKEQAASCCAKPGDSDEKHDCTEKTTRFFQLKTEFTTEKKADEFLSVFDAELCFPVVLFPMYDLLEGEQISGFHPSAHAPPPVSGRTICLRHGVFRC